MKFQLAWALAFAILALFGSNVVIADDLEDCLRPGKPGKTAFQNALKAWNRGNSCAYAREYDRAIKAYDQAIKLRPEFFEAYANRAAAFAEKGDYARTIADTSECIRINAEYAECWVNRGVSYSEMGDLDRALSDLNEAIRLRPKFAEAYVNRSAIRSQMRDYEGGRRDATEAIRLNAKLIEGYGNQAAALMKLERLAEALEVAAAAEKVRPDHPTGAIIRTSVHLLKGELDLALPLAEKAVAMKRYEASLHVRCVARAANGANGALQDCNEALALRPNHPHLLDSRAFAYLKQSKFVEASADYTAALNRKMPSVTASAYFGSGIAKLRLGDKAGGDADIAKAKQLEPKIADQYKLLGVTP
jgi:tetratricopeptide (TPR) repeat protein